MAYALTSAHATDLRVELAARWAGLLSQQDRNWRGPLHVTVQNKVMPSSAKVLKAELERYFVPYEIGATGLEVWYYVGGPWRYVATFPFESEPAGWTPSKVNVESIAVHDKFNNQIK